MQLQLALSLILQILFSPKSPHLVFYGGDEENYLPVQILSGACYCTLITMQEVIARIGKEIYDLKIKLIVITPSAA